MKYPGKFVTIEGGEGVGKTTLINALKELFKTPAFENTRVVFTREPGGTPEAEAIRRMILKPAELYTVPDGFKRNVESEIFLFMAARAAHNAEVIIPALNEGALVICDRYYDSTVAYQMAAAFQAGFEQSRCSEIRSMIQFLNQPRYGITHPNLTLLLTLPQEILRERLKERYAETSEDFIEGRGDSYHHAVFTQYDVIAEENPERIARIVNDFTVEYMVTRAISALDERLGTDLLRGYMSGK